MEKKSPPLFLLLFFVDAGVYLWSMLDAEIQTTILRTQRWVEQVVMGLNLCPFATKVFRGGQIRFVVSPTENPETLLHDLNREIDHLLATPPEETDTTLLIHPMVLGDFMEYWDFVAIAEALLEEKELDGILQIATFHPEYRFSGTEPDSPENYSNRSPYPMLHLLREDSVDLAIDSHPDPEQIPEDNIRLLNSLGKEHLKQLRGKIWD